MTCLISFILMIVNACIGEIRRMPFTKPKILKHKTRQHIKMTKENGETQDLT